MSHYTDTRQAPHGGFGWPSGRHVFEVIAGIALVVVLGVVFFNSNDSPVADVAVPPEAQTSPALISHDALDPFEMQFVSSTEEPVVISHGALDPFEMRSVSLTEVSSTELDEVERAYPMPEFR